MRSVESSFLSTLFKAKVRGLHLQRGLGDDVAFLADFNSFKSNSDSIKNKNSFKFHKKSNFSININYDSLVFAGDSFFEGVHFLRNFTNLENIVFKAFAVNISDILSANAKPLFTLLFLEIPRGEFALASELARLCLENAKNFGLEIIGGDTIAGERLCFSLAILGEIQTKALRRRKIKCGDLLGFISPKGALYPKAQQFGRNFALLKSALRFHKNSKSIESNIESSAKITQKPPFKKQNAIPKPHFLPKNSRFVRPNLNPKMIFALNPLANAGMDISDGLAHELPRLGALNLCSFTLFAPRSFSSANALKKAKKITLKNLLKSPQSTANAWFFSPEEYQMLYALCPKNLARMQNLAKSFRHELRVFAQVKRGKFSYRAASWHK